MSEVTGQVTRAVVAAAADVRRAWRPHWWLYLGGFAALSAAPLVLGQTNMTRGLASGLYIVLAAVGLNFVLGLAEMPSLGHGAFVGIGAFAAALLRTRAGWGPGSATLVAIACAALAGALVGVGAIRLRAAALAAGTWIVAWLVYFTLAAFPNVFGGSQGIVLPEGKIGLEALGVELRLTPAVHLEIALVLVALSLVAFHAVSRSHIGFSLAALRQGRSAAAAVGADSTALQLGAFATSAAIAGISGALTVQLAGIADPASYGPVLSVSLFVAVLLGGAGTLWGPLVGASALAVIPPAARALGNGVGAPPERFEAVLAGILLLVALILGRGGLVRLLVAFTRKQERAVAATVDRSLARPAGQGLPATSLQAHELRKAFGGVAALDGVSLTVEAGRVHALIGPNGSGKTTCLRTLAGVVEADEGRITLADADITNLSSRERLRRGLARTLQRTEVFPEMTAQEHALLGAAIHRRHGGAIRTVLATPKARAETRELGNVARQALASCGLAWAADVRAERLSGADQRLLMIAMACASSPSVLLLDEPAAGMSRTHVALLKEVIQNLSASGITVLLVEHDLRLVRSVADVVTVLSAGEVIAEGTPEEVSGSPVVRRSYLG
ncbi:MAG: branched-chain amino acid transport system ATP-binding protein livF [Actinomycetota bacterium]|nr:branched-chain amino acid transport system ATP-binding protein livF [Actinomycetota bacterium]